MAHLVAPCLRPNKTPRVARSNVVRGAIAMLMVGGVVTTAHRVLLAAAKVSGVRAMAVAVSVNSVNKPSAAIPSMSTAAARNGRPYPL